MVGRQGIFGRSGKEHTYEEIKEPLNSGRGCTKDPNDAHIISLVVVDLMLIDSRNKSEKPNRESAKGEPTYIRDITPCIL